MGYFDSVRRELDQVMDGVLPWITRISSSTHDIKESGGTAADDKKTGACSLCVSVNQCRFVHDAARMPAFPQHPHCRCKLEPCDAPDPSDVTLDFRMEKISNYLFVHSTKSKLIFSWGYTPDDAEEVYEAIGRQAKECYARGEYALSRHDHHGQRIRIRCMLPGKRQKAGRTYGFYTAWMVYPQWELHCNTPFAGEVTHAIS